MRLNYILTIAFIAFGAKADAQDCDKMLLKHRDWKEEKEVTWNLELRSSSGGTLTYFGAQHTDNPNAPQFQQIVQHFKKAQPTVVFFEGPNRGEETTDTATIKKYGESGYVRFLAKQAGIKILSLEPSPSDLYKYLVSKTSQEKVDAYFLLNEVMRLHTRKNLGEQDIEKQIEIMIGKMEALTGGKITIKKIADLKSVYQKYWGKPEEWWSGPKQEWFDPNKSSSATGGIFTNEINTLSSDYRDINMYRILANHVNNGERVFAVVGRNHIPLQQPALNCAVK